MHRYSRRSFFFNSGWDESGHTGAHGCEMDRAAPGVSGGLPRAGVVIRAGSARFQHTRFGLLAIIASDFPPDVASSSPSTFGQQGGRLRT